MDMAMSPDLPAWVCYLVVFLFGGFAAYIQVRRRIGKAPFAWLMPDTWTLLLVYWLVPLVLFWLLDRLGAVADTSFFAAVLVGVGYERIMTSGLNGISAPGDVTSVWQPWVAYADRISAQIRERLQQRQDAFERRIAALVAGNDQRHGALDEWMHAIVDLPPALVGAYDTLKAGQGAQGDPGQAPALPPRTRELRLALLQLKMVGARFNRPGELFHRGVIGPMDYARELLRGGWQGFWFALRGYMLIVVIATGTVLALQYSGRQNDGAVGSIDRARVHYNMWRLAKPGISARDLSRAQSNTADLLSEKATRALTLHETGERLLRPDLPMDRVDALLGLLMRREAESPRDLRESAATLWPALAHPNVDVRRRVQASLVYLARRGGGDPPAEIREWAASENNTPVETAALVAAWRLWWNDAAARP